MSESAFKAGDFVQYEDGRYKVIAIDAERKLVCFMVDCDVIHRLPQASCRLIPGCDSFSEFFPYPVPDCGSGWRLLRKGRNAEPVEKGDEVCTTEGTWFISYNWTRKDNGQDRSMWYRRRVEPSPDRPSKFLSAIRAAGKILRGAGIANVADALEPQEPSLLSANMDDAIDQCVSRINGEIDRISKAATDAIANAWFEKIEQKRGKPTWHAAVGVDVVSREAVCE